MFAADADAAAKQEKRSPRCRSRRPAPAHQRTVVVAAALSCNWLQTKLCQNKVRLWEENHRRRGADVLAAPCM
jgi:hypothetical protein